MDDHEFTPDLRSLASALTALDNEIRQLEAESERFMARTLHTFRKLDICRASVVKLLIEANGGRFPDPAPEGNFPELNRRGG